MAVRWHWATTAILGVVSLASSQQVGTHIPEVHPRLTTWSCTKSGGCTPQNTSIVLDASARKLHAITGDVSCTTTDGNLDSTLCPDATTCARNCALEGVNYEAAGVTTQENGTSNSLTMNMYTDGKSVSPRVYLLDESDNYVQLQLLNREVAFDVDLSQMPCGMNGALYLTEMSRTGGKSKLNPAGAAMGTGYCDAQCFETSFINGEANTNKSGACCNEMDIWEANSISSSYASHVCRKNGVFQCSGSECDSVCDKLGCAYNAYTQGHRSFYGPNGTVDTTKPFTVVTQFIAGTNRSTALLRHRHATHHGRRSALSIRKETAVLTEIRRLYLQGGRLIANVSTTTNTSGESQGISHSAIAMTDAICKSPAHHELGGLKAMGEALQRGMVLVLSIWNDSGTFMNWLDTNHAGTCNPSAGNPVLIQANNPGTKVTWANIKWGEIGSTYSIGKGTKSS